MLRRTLKIVAFLVGLGLCDGSAQDAAAIIAYANQGIVSGNLSMFEPSSAQRITMQFATPAGNALYQRMVALGPVSNVSVASTQPLPNGVMIQARATHLNGISDWTVGYSYVTQRIAFGMFNAFVYPPGQRPIQSPIGGPTQTPTTTTTTTVPTNVTTQPPPNDPCKKYPTLC
jgi:hypothetical protein